MQDTIEIQDIRHTGQVSDSVSDLLARIRNALTAGKAIIAMPHSKMIESVARLLKREGYIRDYRIEQAKVCKVLVLELKYDQRGRSVITGMKRMSKPGRRLYERSDKLPRVLGGLGIALISTSKGLMTSKEAAGHGIGGEVVAWIW